VNLPASSGSCGGMDEPGNGAKTVGATVSGGSTITFTPPFSGDAVLYLSKNASGAGQK